MKLDMEAVEAAMEAKRPLVEAEGDQLLEDLKERMDPEEAEKWAFLHRMTCVHMDPDKATEVILAKIEANEPRPEKEVWSAELIQTYGLGYLARLGYLAPFILH